MVYYSDTIFNTNLFRIIYIGYYVKEGLVDALFKFHCQTFILSQFLLQVFCLFMFVIDPFIEDVRAIGHICAIFLYISLKGEQYVDGDYMQLCNMRDCLFAGVSVMPRPLAI